MYNHSPTPNQTQNKLFLRKIHFARSMFLIKMYRTASLENRNFIRKVKMPPPHSVRIMFLISYVYIMTCVYYRIVYEGHVKAC